MSLTLVEKIAGRHADGLAAGTVVRAGDDDDLVFDSVHEVYLL